VEPLQILPGLEYQAKRMLVLMLYSLIKSGDISYFGFRLNLKELYS
jgi:hypothetical protein